MSTLSCEFCNKTFTNKSILKTHQNTSKKCLADRGLLLTTEYKCEACSIVLLNSKVMEKHFEVCVKYVKLKYQKDIDNLKLSLMEVEGRYKEQKDDTMVYREKLSNIEKQLETRPSNEDYYQLKMENRFLEKQLEKLHESTNNQIISTLLQKAARIRQDETD